ncbi:hypothetical protein BDV96DRAFT_663210 [Lophiotrema nucula]|uniref:Uncharacterized protein n=1 Tax=Lophiotrema nucula TaxID=690887 RepID=A0A6A5ZTL7_9PLEO|nr:hypothetical protein BDV96DRAFT_663210 [Lophiotrema nucula]
MHNNIPVCDILQCDMESPIAIEFEEVVRRRYYGLKPLLEPGQENLCSRLSKYESYAHWNFAEECQRTRCETFMTPRWKARFRPDLLKKRPRSSDGTQDAPSEVDEYVSKRVKLDSFRMTKDEVPPTWIDLNDPIFQDGKPLPPATLVKKLNAMDKTSSLNKPRVFAEVGPGTASISYSCFDGELFYNIYTRAPASEIRDVLGEKSKKSRRNYEAMDDSATAPLGLLRR